MLTSKQMLCPTSNLPVGKKIITETRSHSSWEHSGHPRANKARVPQGRGARQARSDDSHSKTLGWKALGQPQRRCGKGTWRVAGELPRRWLSEHVSAASSWGQPGRRFHRTWTSSLPAEEDGAVTCVGTCVGGCDLDVHFCTRQGGQRRRVSKA